MPRIFISYRRADTASIAGRLYDRLAQHFGADEIFKDVDDIPGGLDFRDVVTGWIERSDVMLVLMGHDWISDRLHNPGDFVRLEIEHGMERDDCRVIPVRVNRAPMPSLNDLPESLHDLAYRNAIPLRDDPDFHRDAGRLIAQIEIEFTTLTTMTAPQTELPRRIERPMWAVGAVTALVIMAAAIIGLSGLFGGESDDSPSETPASSVASAPTIPDTPEPTATETPLPTVTPIPSDTLTPTNTPTATDTPIPLETQVWLDVTASQIAENQFASATAAMWTYTPSYTPTHTPTYTPTPDLTGTYDVQMAAAYQTLTATM